MKTIYNLWIPVILLMTVSAISCNEDNEPELPEEPELLKLGEFTEEGITVLAYSDEVLQTGYNRIYLEVHRSGELLDDINIELTPVMHMEQYSHSSPVENPEALRTGDFNLFQGAAIFTMPGGMAGTWELQIGIHSNHNSTPEIEGIIDIDVEDSNRVIMFMTEGEDRYVLSLIEPVQPETGLNDLIVAFHKRETMMSFPAVSDASFGFKPWMPSMGHGSTNNQDPVHMGNGHYHGVVHFNMSGDWELMFDISRNEDSLGEHVFEINF